MTRFDGWFYRLNEFSQRKTDSGRKVNMSANLFNHWIPLSSWFHEENHRKVSSLISQIDVSKQPPCCRCVELLRELWLVYFRQTQLPETDFSPEYTNQIAPFKLSLVNRTFVPSINTWLSVRRSVVDACSEKRRTLSNLESQYERGKNSIKYRNWKKRLGWPLGFIWNLV